MYTVYIAMSDVIGPNVLKVSYIYRGVIIQFEYITR